MTMKAFLDALEAGLSGSSDAEAVLEFYREMIEDRMEDGMEEEAAVAQLGSVEEILARCVQGLTVPKTPAGAEPGGSISRVEIREREFDVIICEGEGDTYRLEESTRGDHEVSLEGGVLRIVRARYQPERRRLLPVPGELTLYLPKGQIPALDVTTTSGDVVVQKNFAAIHITGASCDVTLSGSFGETVMIQTASGDIALSQVGAGQKLHVESASGDVELTNVKARELRLRSAGGDIDLERVCVEALTLESRSGDMELEQVLSKGDFLCKTVSGDVRLERCDGARMELTTISGDIRGSLLHGKRFSGHTVAGEMGLPNDEPLGSCTVSTVSGDVKLRVEE